MSKIISTPGAAFRSFTFANFTEEAEAAQEDRRKKATEEFKLDHEAHHAAAEEEFVLGGFDFEFRGGYRRDEILKKTSDEIDAMLREAQARVEGIERDAYQKGHAEGLEQGKREGFTEATSLVTALRQGLKELEEARGLYYGKAEKEMIDLTMLIAAEIVRREIRQDPAIVLDVLRKAAAELESKQEITVRMNPRDIELAAGMREQLEREMTQVDHIEFKPDPAITPGGCIVETNIGMLDATVENRLLNIHKTLRAQMEG